MKKKNKSKNKKKKQQKVERYFTIYYTPIPVEHELVVKAESIEKAEAKVRKLLEKECQSIKRGWEVSEDCYTERQEHLK